MSPVKTKSRKRCHCQLKELVHSLGRTTLPQQQCMFFIHFVVSKMLPNSQMKLKQRHLHLVLIVLLLSCFFYGHVQLTSLRKASTTTTTTHGKVVTEFRRRRVHQAWNVSTPVFILSLPKSGTTSLARYFICGGIPTAHTHRFYNGSWYRLGDCFRQNIIIHEKHRPMLDGCGPYQVWSDLVRYIHSQET